MKKLYTFFGFILFSFIISSNAVAVDENYDWPSGYKYRTDPNEETSDGSMDKENAFKGETISGNQVDLSNIRYVDLKAYFPVSQTNWSSTTACREGGQQELNVADCTFDGKRLSVNKEWTYTCKGDVTYTMMNDTSSKNVVGTDTMYGAWSMLFNYLPPAFGENCGEDGRCFVGNALIMDTKSQKEANPGLFPSLGTKELVGAPGEVYYFDQVRSLTQPPITSELEPYNDIVLVGTPIEGGEVVDCVLPDLTSYNVSGDCGICGSPIQPNGGGAPLGELAKQILTAAGQTHNVPAAVIWSAMMHEGGNWGNVYEFSDANVLKWSLPVGCTSYEPMPECDNNDDAAVTPFGLMKYWVMSEERIWDAVKVIDPRRDSPDKVSRCNFMDAAFTLAEMLRQGYSMHVGTACDPCGGYAFNNFAPASCNSSVWTDAKVVQSNVGFMGQCPNGANPITECGTGNPLPALGWYPQYFLNQFTPYSCTP